ncbi:tol-Pal system protein TolA-like [Athalia rosae]|uniref:tol-Pal system protein TolA-like n=1 Tax=Athalia rosae TaxID=37344 RepID=UPI002033EAF8|nr:tol-Pal system protein TolA-like [Athalia rosae]
MAAAVTNSNKKEKRGVAIFGVPAGWDVFGGAAPAYGGGSAWAPSAVFNGGWGSPDLALGQIQLQATHNVALQALKNPTGTPSIAYPPEVVQAVQQAKDASHNVLIAQQRVAEAKQAALIQQKIALAKEANAREAAHRSEEISAHAQAEARASARQLVASQQRLATLKDAVAAAQRVAAAREAAAAAAIQRTASATAAELRKQDVDKQISISEEEARQKDIVAAKENAIANALQHAPAEKPSYSPWG